MNASGISIDVEGQTTDLADVSWCAVAPCGCVSGLTVGFSDYGNGPPHVVVTADQAAAQFWETTAERKKYERLGFTPRPALREQSAELFAKCDHTPRYGYTRPSREGMSWAVGGYHGRRTSVRHLIPDEATKGYKPATALCGQSQHHWSTDSWDLDGKVECSHCVKLVTP